MLVCLLVLNNRNSFYERYLANVKIIIINGMHQLLSLFLCRCIIEQKILNSLGHCACYEVVQRLLTGLANRIQSLRDVFIPSNINVENPGICHLAADNLDFQECTLAGKNTTRMIVIQNTSKESDQACASLQSSSSQSFRDRSFTNASSSTFFDIIACKQNRAKPKPVINHGNAKFLTLRNDLSTKSITLNGTLLWSVSRMFPTKFCRLDIRTSVSYLLLALPLTKT